MIRSSLFVAAAFVALAAAGMPARTLAQAPSPTPYAPAPPLFPSDAASAPLTATSPSTPPAGDVRPATHQQTVSLSPPEARANKPLQLPAAPGSDASRTKAGGASGFGTMLAALGVVLGLFLAVVGLLRRGMPKPARMLPKEAVEVLGRIPLPGRCQGHLIRVGNKIALVGFSGGGGETLVEITDPLEVDRLAGLCRQDDPHSATTSFRGIVDQFFKDKNPSPLDAAGRQEIDDV